MKSVLHAILAITITASVAFSAQAGTLSKERLESLRLSCLNEAERANGHHTMWRRSTHSSIPINDPEVEKMKDVCRRLTNENRKPHEDGHGASAQECHDQVEALLASRPQDSEHSEKLRQICEEMAGEKIAVHPSNAVK
jgi:hypothetical protein